MHVSASRGHLLREVPSLFYCKYTSRMSETIVPPAGAVQRHAYAVPSWHLPTMLPNFLRAVTAVQRRSDAVPVPAAGALSPAAGVPPAEIPLPHAVPPVQPPAAAFAVPAFPEPPPRQRVPALPTVHRAALPPPVPPAPEPLPVPPFPSAVRQCRCRCPAVCRGRQNRCRLPLCRCCGHSSVCRTARRLPAPVATRCVLCRGWCCRRVHSAVPVRSARACRR